MSTIILPDRWRRQPTYWVEVSHSSHLGPFSYWWLPHQSAKSSVIVGTLQRGGKGGSAVGFGSSLGSGTTDSIELSYNGSSEKRTILARIYVNGSGGGGFGRVYDKRVSGSQVDTFNYDGGNLAFSRVWSGAVEGVKATAPSGWADVAVVSDGVNAPVIYVNGQSVALSNQVAPFGTLTTTADNFVLGNRKNDSARAFDGAIEYFYILPVALSVEQAHDVSVAPYQGFKKAARILYFTAPSGGGATIAGDSGTYTLTGSDVSLKAGRKLAADSGTYSLTGTAAALRVGRKLAADSGSYSLSGTDAAFKRGYALAASSGTYTVSGTAVSLKAGRKLAADSGSYTLTGTDATLTYAPAGSYNLTAESGSYSLTGTAATLKVSRKLSADSGAYSLTGTTATLAKGVRMAAASGSYTLTGSNVSFARTYVLTAESGSYTLTGTSAGLTWSGAPVVEAPTNGGPSIYGKPVFREKQFRKEYEEQVKRIEDEKRLARILREDEEITVIMALMAA